MSQPTQDGEVEAEAEAVAPRETDPTEQEMDREVRKRLFTKQANVFADKLLAEAMAGDASYRTLPDEPLDVALLRPEPTVEWRLAGLLGKNHNTTIAAAAKVGKTTLLVNRVKSLVDGSPFLREYDVDAPVDGRVGVWNYELNPAQMHGWFRSVDIKNASKVTVLNLRGQGLFLQDQSAQDWAIEWLVRNEVEVWEIDPLQAALRGSVNDDAVTAEWIQAVERVKAEAGVLDLILTTHTGHLKRAGAATGEPDENERSIGSSRWIGWPDNTWIYVKDPDGERFLRTMGRDSEVEEFGLSYDVATRELRSRGTGTSRKDAAKSKTFRALLVLVRDSATGDRWDLDDLDALLPGGTAGKRLAIREAEACGLLEKTVVPTPPGTRGRPKGVFTKGATADFVLRSAL